MLIFDPSTHVYRNPFTLQEYISTTKLISKFKKPFNLEEVSKRIAEKEGVSQDHIKAKWKKLNDDSKVYGQKIHSALEEYNKTKTFSEEDENLIEAYKSLKIIDEKDNLLIEEKIHNHIFKIAGTADIIRLEDNGGFSVFDIKTNKKFNFFNQYSEYLLHPVSHLTACEFTTYSLQLSLYAYMYQGMTGRNINQLGVFYYDRNKEKFEYYPVIYLKNDINLILDYYAKNLVG